MGAIGKALHRREDRRLLTGNGRFSDDFNMAGQAYAAFVRSPHAHARIIGMKVARSCSLPGVLGVFSGADCLAEGLGPIHHNPVPATRYDLPLTAPGGGKIFVGPHLLLPSDKARHVGEALAMIVAETMAQAIDAAEAVAIEYAVLTPVRGVHDALKPGAPAVWDEVPDNVLVDSEFGDAAATERAFAAAAFVVEAEFRIGRVTAVALEPRAALAHYDGLAHRYTLYAGSGGAVRQKRELASVLGIAADRLRVLSHDVGGNFGSRNRTYVEFGLVLWAARKFGRPIKYTATRSEAFLSDYQGRDLVSKVALALRSDGRFLAMRAVNVSNVGARCVSLSPLGKGAGLITGSYDIASAALRARAVFTNTMPTNAYRSSGRPEVTFALERLIDIAARELGFDRIELRRKNLIRAESMPYTNAVGSTYDSGQYEANMDLVMRIADWQGFERRRRDAAERGKLLGRGLANYVESSIGAPKERATITVTGEGTVDVIIGTQSAGQGHETSFAQVVSDLLHVPFDAVNIITGDTDIVSAGGGSHSGRSMRHAATVLSKAAEGLLAKAKEIAAVLMAAPREAVEYAEGRFRAPTTNLAFTLRELAQELARSASRDQTGSALCVTCDNEMHDPVFPNGCAVCECEVDAETGGVQITRYAAVDDVGRCVNPMIVHGQTQGAIAQGIGQAMWERCHLQDVSAQPLCGSLMDYALPRSDTLPALRTEIVEILSPTNPLGIKAGGEGGTTPAPAAVINAIIDALGAWPIRDLTMPATPFAVWQAMRKAGADL